MKSSDPLFQQCPEERGKVPFIRLLQGLVISLAAFHGPSLLDFEGPVFYCHVTVLMGRYSSNEKLFMSHIDLST